MSAIKEFGRKFKGNSKYMAIILIWYFHEKLNYIAAFLRKRCFLITVIERSFCKTFNNDRNICDTARKNLVEISGKLFLSTWQQLLVFLKLLILSWDICFKWIPFWIFSQFSNMDVCINDFTKKTEILHLFSFVNILCHCCWLRDLVTKHLEVIWIW